MKTNEITESIIGSAIKVHKVLGPGLLESTYRACLVHELRRRGMRVKAEWPLPVSYEGLTIDVGYRVDLLVEDVVLVELKAVERLLSVHDAQLLAYLRISGLHVGLLINFCVPYLRLGIKRLVNRFDESEQ